MTLLIKRTTNLFAEFSLIYIRTILVFALLKSLDTFWVELHNHLLTCVTLKGGFSVKNVFQTIKKTCFLVFDDLRHM